MTQDERGARAVGASLRRAAEAAREVSADVLAPPSGGVGRLQRAVAQRRQRRRAGVGAGVLVVFAMAGGLLYSDPFGGEPEAPAPLVASAPQAPVAETEARRVEEAPEETDWAGRVGDVSLFAGEGAVWSFPHPAAVELTWGLLCVHVQRPRTSLWQVTVRTPEATATVVGTRFCVRAFDDGTRVSVAEGVVSVRYGEADAVLVRGGQLISGAGVAPLAVAEAALLEELLGESAAAPERASAPARPAPEPDDAVAVGTTPVPPPVERPSCDERYVAAERALRSEDWEAAARRLERVVRACPRARHAGAALIEIGRLALGPLGDPERARRVYDDYLARFPGGRLQRSALAGRCLALSRCGRLDEARDCAASYLGRYPDGPHAEAIRRLGMGDRDAD